MADKYIWDYVKLGGSATTSLVSKSHLCFMLGTNKIAFVPLENIAITWTPFFIRVKGFPTSFHRNKAVQLNTA